MLAKDGNKRLTKKIRLNMLSREYPELGEHATSLIESYMRIANMTSLSEFVKRIKSQKNPKENTSSFTLIDMLLDQMLVSGMQYEIYLLFTVCCLGHGPFPEFTAARLGYYERNMNMLISLGFCRSTNHGVLIYPFVLNYMSSRTARVMGQVDLSEMINRCHNMFTGSIQSQWELSSAINLWHIISQLPGLPERYYRLSVNIVRAMERLDRDRTFRFIEQYWLSLPETSPVYHTLQYEWGMLLFDRFETRELGIKLLKELFATMPTTHPVYNWLCLFIGDYYCCVGSHEEALVYYNKSMVSYLEQYPDNTWEVDIVHRRIESVRKDQSSVSKVSDTIISSTTNV